MSFRLARGLLVLSSLALAAAAEPEAAAEAEAAALTTDDECAEGSSEQCSLNALQVKKRQSFAGGENLTGPPAPESEPFVVAEALRRANEVSYEDVDASNDTISVQSSSYHHHGHGGYKGRIVTGWHQTSVAAGHAILRGGFRPGHVGYCGGGIYFAASPWATGAKAVGPESHHGFVIEAKIDLGREKAAGRSCMSPHLGFDALSHTPTSQHLHRLNADSFVFNPFDGIEYVIANPQRVISMHQYHR